MITYRVNVTCLDSEEDEIPAGGKIRLDLPGNASCTVCLEAGTERGFNSSLRPASVTIPSHESGQSQSVYLAAQVLFSSDGCSSRLNFFFFSSVYVA